MRPSPLTIQWTFTPSKSLNFPVTLIRARQGDFTEQRTTEGKRESIVYTTTFTFLPTLEAMTPALLFAESIHQERSAQATVNGLAVRPQDIARVLNCYYHSLQCSDPRGYCWVPIFLRGKKRTRPVDHDFEIARGAGGAYLSELTEFAQEIKAEDEAEEADRKPEPPWYFPCRLAQPRAYDLNRSHPASIRSQTDSVLVREGCHWCPQLRLLDEWDIRYGHGGQDTDEQPQKP